LAQGPKLLRTNAPIMASFTDEMVLKDFSVDLGLADTDGLALLVERFQVDDDIRTRQYYHDEPYL